MLIFSYRKSTVIEEINYNQIYVYIFFTFTYYTLINNDITLAFIVRDLE